MRTKLPKPKVKFPIKKLLLEDRVKVSSSLNILSVYLSKFKKIDFRKFFALVQKLNKKIRKFNFKKFIEDEYAKSRKFIRNLNPAFIKALIRRHFPLFLAILFITPAVIALGIFIYSRLNKTPTFAASFTGKVKVSKQTTTLSSATGWYTSMAHSGDGINGDAETGTFNPIHPGRGAGTEPGAGDIAMGHVPMAATSTYAAAQFIGFKPNLMEILQACS